MLSTKKRIQRSKNISPTEALLYLYVRSHGYNEIGYSEKNAYSEQNSRSQDAYLNVNQYGYSEIKFCLRQSDNLQLAL